METIQVMLIFEVCKKIFKICERASNKGCYLGDNEHEKIPELYEINEGDESEDENMDKQG